LIADESNEAVKAEDQPEGLQALQAQLNTLQDRQEHLIEEVETIRSLLQAVLTIAAPSQPATGTSLPAPTIADRPPHLEPQRKRPLPAWLRQYPSLVGSRWWPGIGVLALFLIAVAVRFHSIALIGSGMYGDEATTIVEARNFLSGVHTSPFINDRLADPAFYEFMLAQVFRVTGVSVLVAREFSAIWGALCVPLLYGLAREIGCRRSVAFGAAGFLATASWQVHFSSMAILTIHMVASDLAVLYCVAVAVNRRSILWAILAGASTAMALNSYIGGRVIIPILVLWFGYMACLHMQWFPRQAVPTALKPPLNDPGYRAQPRSLVAIAACLCICALVLAYPLIHYYLTTPGQLSGHTTDMFAFGANGIQLYREQLPNAPSNWWNILWHQITASIGMFTWHNENADVLFHQPGQPALDGLTSVFFVLGLAASIFRWRRAGSMLVVLSLLAAYVFGTVLTIQPPSMVRTLFAAPLLSLFAALGVEVTVLFVLHACHVLGPLIGRGRSILVASRLYLVAARSALPAAMALVVIVAGVLNLQRDSAYVQSADYRRNANPAAISYGKFLGSFGSTSATIVAPYGYAVEYLWLFAPQALVCNGLWTTSWQPCPPAHIVIFDDGDGSYAKDYGIATGHVPLIGSLNSTGQPAYWYVMSPSLLPDPAQVLGELPP